MSSTSNSRPTFIDLRHADTSSTTPPTPGSARSPRLHITGEVPPAYSPLDAFAIKSRLLAKQLEEGNKSGRRMSRLPPLTTESPIVSLHSCDYSRLAPAQDPVPVPRNVIGLGLRTDIDDNVQDRPTSTHPRMSHVSSEAPLPDSIKRAMRISTESTNSTRSAGREEYTSFLGGGRTMSPPPSMSPKSGAREEGAHTPIFNAPLSASPERFAVPKGVSLDSCRPQQPLRSRFPPRSASAIASSASDHDNHNHNEDGISPLSTSFFSSSRKLSMSTNSIISPTNSSSQFQHSPSISSEVSSLPRPSPNFSRPISRASTTALDTPPPRRQTSSDSQASYNHLHHDDTAHTPISINSEGFPDAANPDESIRGAPSYIYSKFVLPHGKSVQPSSRLLPDDGQCTFDFQLGQSHVARHNTAAAARRIGQPPPSPPTRPTSPSGPGPFDNNQTLRLIGGEPSPQLLPSDHAPSLEVGRRGHDTTDESSALSNITTSSSFSHSPHPQRLKTTVSTATYDSSSTAKPAHSQHSLQSMADTPPDEHVALAIELHEKGSVNESTYHLRHAARQGHPTGMLLYALACRHGWGMRPNMCEAVEWLRKAAASASLEIADDESQVKGGKPVDFAGQKAHKAQFALSIYELGVSHMQGWGIEQDKALALRCFEIAGTWGDVDALAEAGFCYANGIGCKKDLKKSAKFYREAEAKGMSMVGNSWIYKAKYMDSANDSDKASTKSRSKKHLFGIKS